MIHYKCDRCHREIAVSVEKRYSVEMRISAQCDDSVQPKLDPDADHLLDLHELLERVDLDRIDETISGQDVSELPTEHQFDLCADCFKAYARNPLSCEFPATIGFSNN